MDSSPIRAKVGRLFEILSIYDRDEIWMEVSQVHDSPTDQLFTGRPQDAAGNFLHARDRTLRCHMFFANPDLPPVQIGDRFRIFRDDHGTRVEKC